jgi:hypothetical protein
MLNPDRIRDVRNDLFAGVRDPEAAQLQPVADQLMGELRTLDLTNPRVAVEWLERFNELAGTAGVFFDAEEILRRYAAVGYMPRTGEPTDYKGTAQRVIGNALDCYEVMGHSHPMIVTQIARLKERYPEEFDIEPRQNA